MSKLFTPAHVGPYRLNHRVVMAPLTRMRAGQGEVPTALMAKYYGQRASQGGLLISEATPVSPRGFGYAHTPGIFTRAQVQGWRKITDTVHAHGGRIFLQLWHVGRQSHPLLQPDGALPLAPSEIAATGDAYTDEGAKPFATPRALETDEIPAIVGEFRLGAAHALAAGFDGVEIHGANGYLPDQFLQDGSNKRTDIYGGPIENRARFLLEIVDAAIAVWGPARVGVRLSPSGTYGCMHDSNPAATFGYVAAALNARRVGYLHVVEPRIVGSDDGDVGAPAVAAAALRTLFTGTIIAAGGFGRDSAGSILMSGDADLVAFGRHFISNPDLPERLRHGWPFAAYDRTTFYGGGARGYTDYTSFQQHAAAA